MPINLIKELRQLSGAGVMECHQALSQADNSLEKALQLLRQRGLAVAEKKQHRDTSQGLVETYTHPGGRLGAIVEVNCESDFVARTEEFKALAHDLVLQVAATSPKFISSQDMPPETPGDPRELCLLLQPFIKDEGKTVEERIKETIAQLRENIRVKRFSRFQLGD